MQVYPPFLPLQHSQRIFKAFLASAICRVRILHSLYQGITGTLLLISRRLSEHNGVNFLPLTGCW